MHLNRLLAPVLIAGLVFTSASCSKGSSDDGGKKGNQPTASAGAGDKVKSSGVHSPPLPEQPALKHPTGIRSDASMTSCGTKPGTVQAEGTVKNTSSKPADIVVTVNWTNATYDVVARGVATLEDVKPKAEMDWKADTKLGKGYGKVDCLLNVRRGSLS